MLDREILSSRCVSFSTIGHELLSPFLACQTRVESAHEQSKHGRDTHSLSHPACESAIEHFLMAWQHRAAADQFLIFSVPDNQSEWEA